MEERQQQQQEERSNEGKKTTIVIPSFQSVSRGDTSNSGSNANSNSPFARAFSFIKSSEFYSPPPPPPSEPLEKEEGNVGLASEDSTTRASSASTSSQNRNAILVSHRQKGNPLLKHIRNVKWVFTDVVCDFLLGQNSCALYLSLRYHLLHPDYLYFRIRELQNKFKLRVVLCHVDVEDVVKPLQDVTRTALLHDCTLLCGWSMEECGRYLETIKVYENKSADTIREQMDNDYLSRLNHAVTTVRHVNKTDVITLGSTFGSLSHVMDASMEELARCPGIGERKVKRLYDTFHEPFKRVSRQPPLIPDASEEKNRDVPLLPCQSNDELEGGEASSVAGSESINTVKSALAAAFAKYKNKVNKKNGKEQGFVDISWYARAMVFRIHQCGIKTGIASTHVVEMKLPEKFVVMSIIENFPKSWDDFSLNLKHKKGNMTLNDLMIDIAIEEEHRSQKLIMPVDSNPRVSLTIEKKQTSDPKGKLKMQYKAKAKIQKKPQNKLCWICGQVGHWAKECPTKKVGKLGTSNEGLVNMLTSALGNSDRKL